MPSNYNATLLSNVFEARREVSRSTIRAKDQAFPLLIGQILHWESVLIEFEGKFNFRTVMLMPFEKQYYEKDSILDVERRVA